MVENLATNSQKQTSGFRKEFLSEEAASGVILVIAAFIALVLVNSPAGSQFRSILDAKLSIVLPVFEVSESIHWWINDGLMALFFFLVGMEIKREVLEDRLSEVRRAVLPVVSAIGGIVIPVSIYFFLNADRPENLNGWAIPAATDIAFALGVLAFLAHRMPAKLRVILLAIAIIDDLAAILIIAVAYTDQLRLIWLWPIAIAVATLIALNRLAVIRVAPYILTGILLWIGILKAGIHPTLAGVAVAFAIPLRVPSVEESDDTPLRDLESGLHPWVAFGILPLFALSNAGVPLEGIGLGTLTQPLFLGIVLGLVIGKPLGVIGGAWIGIRLGLCRMPDGISWRQYCGMGALTGIGFTMSLFIGALALPAEYLPDVRSGVMAGSILSALMGVVFLRYVAQTARESAHMSGKQA